MQKMTPENLKEIEEMQTFLEMEYAKEPAAMSERISQLNVYMARSGYLLAEAKYEQDRAMMKFEQLKELIPLAASVQKELLKAACAEENRLVNWLDRINRTCVHQSENLRTQLSFEKEMQRQGGYADNPQNTDSYGPRNDFQPRDRDMPWQERP